MTGRPRSADAPPQRIISGIRQRLVELRIRLGILRVALRLYGNPLVCLRVLRSLDAKRRLILGNRRLNKVARAGGMYYWDMYTPGWPSAAFDAFIRAEAARIRPVPHIRTNGFTNIFIAITKKCSLQCAHCFEWDALNGQEALSAEDLGSLVQDFQERGVAIIQLTGGEPMLRFADTLQLLESARKDAQFWMLSSGFKLTADAARLLKRAGLTGVALSLDHFDPEMHNAFRGFRNAYHWVEEAVAAARSADLVLALSLCPTRAFVTEANLHTYAELARTLGVSFIQILEPKAVGHYAGKDVQLTPEQTSIIESFYLQMNYDRRFASYPIVTYHGYHQRRVGCFGAGNRNLYVDTDGDLHACPFCRTKRGSALGAQLDASIAALQQGGCHGFRVSDI